MISKQRSIGITIPAEADYIDIVRLTLYGIATRIGFSYEQIEDMKVAVSEACNNVVIHAYDNREVEDIEIAFEEIKDGLVITIKDKGNSFDYEKTVKKVGPVNEESISNVKIGELGIYIMQELMDDIKVNSSAETGTEVILTKLLKRE